MRLTVEFLDDPAAFLAVAGEHLAAEPVRTTVVAAVTDGLARRRSGEDPPDGEPPWWAMLRDDGGSVVGMAMRTPPHPAYLLSMPDDAATLLARSLHARGEHVDGANGALPAVRVFADELTRLTGGSREIAMHTRLFELAEVVAPRVPTGSSRPATLDDLDLVVDWFERFRVDVELQGGRSPDQTAEHERPRAEVVERVRAGLVRLWLDEAGTPVHLTSYVGPTYGVARIAPVFTPAEHRGKGYASALVAQVSQELVDDGARVCLFTDQANPVSNHVYEAIGFRPVVDMAHLRIT